MTAMLRANASGLQWASPCDQAFSQTDLWLAAQTQLFQKVVVLVLCRCEGVFNRDQLSMCEDIAKNPDG